MFSFYYDKRYHTITEMNISKKHCKTLYYQGQQQMQLDFVSNHQCLFQRTLKVQIGSFHSVLTCYINNGKVSIKHSFELASVQLCVLKAIRIINVQILCRFIVLHYKMITLFFNRTRISSFLSKQIHRCESANFKQHADCSRS